MNLISKANASSFEISVVVCSYQPKIDALIKTIRSIILQEGVKFQIIITDDGSETDCFDELRRYFILHNFTDYRLIKSETNVGTVRNYINGIDAADSEYIKPISPGDYLYNCKTLKDIYNFMLTNNAPICFGDAAYYSSNGDGQPVLAQARNSPQEIQLYNGKSYDYKKIKKHYLLNDDLIVGAAFCARKNILIHYLTLIRDKVIYAEDYLFRIAVADGVRLWYMDQYIVWYEYGSGISTTNDKKNKWHKILIQESVVVFEIIKGLYPHDRVDKQALQLHKLIAENRMLFYRILKLLIIPCIASRNKIKRAVMANSRNVNMKYIMTIYETNGEG